MIERVQLHTKAGLLLDQKPPTARIDPHPGKLFVVTRALNSAEVLCFVGSVRIALIGLDPSRVDHSGSGTLIEIEGDLPNSGETRSAQGIPYFRYAYADGQAKCFVHELPFLIRDGRVQLNDQSFEIDTPTVALVNPQHEIV